MAAVTHEFESAPAGGRMIGKLVVVLLALAGAMAAVIAVQRASGGMPAAARAVSILAPAVALAVMIPMYFLERSRIARFTIEDGCLVLGRRRYPLAGLTEAARDPHVLSWAFRIRGNGGLGAIRGQYWSRRIGKFEAFMTDPAKAVILRWPDRTVAVSPDDPEFFLYCVRSATGVR